MTFGLFEVDLKAGELWKAGYRVKLQGLPFKVLSVLLENAGEVVTREELQNSIWGPDVIVDFEHSLSNAIKKLREALGDSADNPRFIETLSRRGFRFIAPVGFAETRPQSASNSTIEIAVIPVAENQSSASAAALQPENSPSARSWRRYIVPILSFGLGSLLVGAAIQSWNARQPHETLYHISQITQDGTIYSPMDTLLGTLSAFVTDGTHLFTPSNENGGVVLSQISMATGERQVLPLPSELGVPEIEDISPDGTKLLVRSNLAAASLQPLWIVPIDGGSASRVSDVLAQDATWMPDGKNILYTSGNQLAVVSLENGRSTAFATVAGRAFWPRWSPDGKLLRFTIIDTVNHTSSLWEISGDGRVARPLLKNWSVSPHECCGVWTADGKLFVFEATRDGHADLWKVNAPLDSSPVRVTNGPLNYKAPAPGRNGEQIFFIGKDVQSRLDRYDSERKEYVPLQGFLANASHVRFSRDGQWVAWVDSNSRLWRARINGTDKLLLTPASMEVFMAAWSPDGTQLAVMSRGAGQPWQIYTVNADGGNPERLLQKNQNLGDPSFSPDGKYIVFGMVPELMEQANVTSSLEIIELSTHRITEVPHSEGLFSPRWSPDGRFIAAVAWDQTKVTLYDTQSQIWKTLAITSAANPVWSRDSKALYIHAYLEEETKPIYRVSVPSGQMTKIASLSNFPVGSNITNVEFSGITPDDAPLVHTEISSGNLYTLDFKSR
ncbi:MULTISPECIES: winged helix-turn-helix domain-containing protein [Acidobacteriaceae]|uniref:winged helix-turn-helix domain-containing protein n=1 Tax=Acidobacteriaceae TaxID=204434 RepID=UPI00131AD4AF|nr:MULTISPECIES: winged helix-turn-helix domain-containing protein [Acidobacteriaceae]MDW5267439.1 winged helix-turn-helix domain-containing protein [Edaphobacter sp.]